MIFGRYYDMALWLMSYGCKKQGIINFIENIPEEFLKKIQKSLLIYQHYLVGDRDAYMQDGEFDLSDSIRTPGDMLYWYSINIETGAIDMGEAIDDGEGYYDTFQMTLYPLKRKHYMNLENFEEHLLGDASYNFFEENIDDLVKIFDFDYMNFNLFRLPFGIMLLRSGETSSYYKNGKVERNRYNFLSIRDIPKDYTIGDLKNRHVRCRKINNGSK